MKVKLLYVEDDIIDVLALERLIDRSAVDLQVVNTFSELSALDIQRFDAVLCDSNLPDADFEVLSKHLDNVQSVTFISGSEISGRDVLLKPIRKEDLKKILTPDIVNFSYINALASGDEEYKKEMIDTALSVLPDRSESILTNAGNFVELKKAAHKAKSSYRVCGIDPKFLTILEALTEEEFSDQQRVKKLVNSVVSQIELAILQLQEAR